VRLPVEPPLTPMLGKLVRELPLGDFVYEPKWDGFRCLAFRSGEEVDLRSRHGRALARYFPEVVAGLRALPRERFVLDGEVLVARDGEFDFHSLMARLHPAASRVERLARETPARFMVFDVLALDDANLCDRPLKERRAALEELLADRPAGIHLTPVTDDAAAARRWLDRFQGAGIDGVIAKPRDLPYRPGVRAMLKVKHERTADCVVAGCRASAEPLAVLSLLLGLYEPGGQLRHVGVASGFSRAKGAELAPELAPLVTSLRGHPWERGFLLGGGHMGRLKGAAGRWDPETMAPDWVPLEPRRVCEVAYDQVDDLRFRHAARFRRWRPDREPRSCLLEQLEPAGGASTLLRS
jgi:ATP-dependent DNA ligase